MRPTFIAFLFCLFSFSVVSVAQSQQVTPAWVKMMDDPNTNYYEAIKSFEQFWKGKEKPMEEGELINENMNKEAKKEHRNAERKLRNMSPVERQQYDYLTYQFKRFNNWRHEVKQFVQEDGHILSQEERNNIFEQQQQEINNRKH
jgi:hypothetical protein